MSKETENAYKKFGKDLMNVKKNWKKSEKHFKNKESALDAVMKEAGWK
tara:strand:- start:218 stop:361 length:144 start_codon:yes stop_codon:yes gene_type:complete